MWRELTPIAPFRTARHRWEHPGKAELRAYGATNLLEHGSRITHHSSGVRVPFGLIPIKSQAQVTGAIPKLPRRWRPWLKGTVSHIQCLA